MKFRSKPATKYSQSRTIPGQSLYPADLLRRHLAGTLPDIDRSKAYEFHYDAEGNQIAEPLALEYHELQELAVVLRRRQYEEAIEKRKADAAKFRDKIISDYVASQASAGPEKGETAQNPTTRSDAPQASQAQPLGTTKTS